MEAEKVSDLRPQIVPRKESMKAVLEIRPRFVWGCRPRPNGGRRRPRGRFGYHKYPVVVSRGCYPAAKPPHLRAPTRVSHHPAQHITAHWRPCHRQRAREDCITLWFCVEHSTADLRSV